MLIRANTDGTYSANWTPGAVGLYTIHVTIDGIEIGMSAAQQPALISYTNSQTRTNCHKIMWLVQIH